MDKRKTVGDFFLKSRAIIKRCSEEASAKADGSHRDGECFSEHVMAYYAEKHLYSARLRLPAWPSLAVPMWLCGAARACCERARLARVADDSARRWVVNRREFTLEQVASARSRRHCRNRSTAALRTDGVRCCGS
jgi:hypothetical protein